MKVDSVTALLGEKSLAVGDRIRDNDPRMLSGRRVLTISRTWHPLRSGSGIEPKAIAVDSMGHEFAILLRRIYTDGKARKSGFSLIPNTAEGGTKPGAEDRGRMDK